LLVVVVSGDVGEWWWRYCSRDGRLWRWNESGGSSSCLHRLWPSYVPVLVDKTCVSCGIPTWKLSHVDLFKPLVVVVKCRHESRWHWKLDCDGARLSCFHLFASLSWPWPWPWSWSWSWGHESVVVVAGGVTQARCVGQQ
jgi:hypothetical protein